MPRDVRTRLLIIVVAALAVALGVATVAFNVLITHSTAANADSLLRQRAETERDLIRVTHGKLTVVEGRDDPLGDSRVWIYRSGHPVGQEPRHHATRRIASAISTGRGGFANVQGTDERLYALPIVVDGRRYGAVVTGVSLAPYEQTRSTALDSSLAFALALLLIVGAAVAWLLRSTLRPVASMTERAAAWSEHDLDKRFALGEPHDELTRLAHTLDRLLDRIAASLRHERLFSAELSHELRTPLAKLTAEAELALRRERTPAEYREAIGEVLANAAQITRIVETLLAAAQQQGGPHGLADADEVARAAAAACAQIAAEHGIELAVGASPQPLRVGVDQALAERIIQPVLDNACRYGAAHVNVAFARANGAVVFTIDDDGPGVAEEEREEIFEPARRGGAGHDSGPGAGLGLALARRLARSVSGDVEAVAMPVGARFVVRLPAA
jgi:two-component system, OmpR family, sensor kinase